MNILNIIDSTIGSLLASPFLWISSILHINPWLIGALLILIGIGAGNDLIFGNFGIPISIGGVWTSINPFGRVKDSTQNTFPYWVDLILIGFAFIGIKLIIIGFSLPL